MEEKTLSQKADELLKKPEALSEEEAAIIQQDKEELLKKASVAAQEDDNKEVIIDNRVTNVMQNVQSFSGLITIPAIVCPKCNGTIQFGFNMKNPITGINSIVASCQTEGCDHTELI